MITVLTGTNAYALRQELAAIKTKFLKTYGDSGIEAVEGEELGIQNVPVLLQGVTLFSTNRLVIIRNVSKNKSVAEKLQDLLGSIPVEVHLVLVEDSIDKRTAFYKALKKETDFHEFLPLDEPALIKWIAEAVKQQGGKISPSATRLLIRYAGADQIHLENEIQKLVAYNHTVSEQTITELVEKNTEETVFELLENALNGNTKKALIVLEGLEAAHEDPFQAANMLIWQTHILAVVSSAGSISESEVAKAFKINPYVIKKTKRIAHQMNKAKLRNVISQVAKLDITLKSTSSDPWRVLETAVLSM